MGLNFGSTQAWVFMEFRERCKTKMVIRVSIEPAQAFRTKAKERDGTRVLVFVDQGGPLPITGAMLIDFAYRPGNSRLARRRARPTVSHAVRGKSRAVTMLVRSS